MPPWKLFFSVYVCFKILTQKSIVSIINWNIEKSTTQNTEGLKRGPNNNYENDIDVPFYLAFPTVIYLFKINNKNRKAMCKICPKSLVQMCQTKVLQMCSFSIILTYVHSLNLSFPLLFYSISTTIIKFAPWFPASPHFCTSTQFPWITTLIFCTCISIQFPGFDNYHKIAVRNHVLVPKFWCMWRM